MDVEEWDRVMETNVRGVFLTCRAAARSMVAHGTAGKIITISSGAYASGRPGAAHYCASKAAVVMFTKVLALELAKARINANCIAPGFVRVDSEVSPLTEEYVTALTRASRGAARARRATSPTPRCSWPRPSPTTSRARCSRSTAAPPPAARSCR